MIQAHEQIRDELGTERRSRAQRSWLTALACLVVPALVALWIGVRPFSPLVLAYLILALALFVLWLSLSARPEWSLERASLPIALLIPTFPLLFSLLAPGSDPSGPAIHGACFLSVVMIGAAALSAEHWVLGTRARRFGGAPEVFLAFAAGIGVAGIGIACPFSGPLHLLNHSAGALVLMCAFAIARHRSRAAH
jgi:hypothetical protein